MASDIDIEEAAAEQAAPMRYRDSVDSNSRSGYMESLKKLLTEPEV